MIRLDFKDVPINLASCLHFLITFLQFQKNMKFSLVSKHLQENRPAVAGTKPTTKPETSEHAFDHALEGHDILLDNWDQDYARKKKNFKFRVKNSYIDSQFKRILR